MENQLINGTNMESKIPPKSKLKAIKPMEVKPSKPKILIYGKAGVGKTWISIDFPDVFYIDTEKGSDLEDYQKKLEEVGGYYFGSEQGSTHPKTLLEQFQALATEKHGFRTVVIDSVSKIMDNMTMVEWDRLDAANPNRGADFGASRRPAVRWFQRMIFWANKMDLNVIFISHQKDLWGTGSAGKIGETFDVGSKVDYDLHLLLQIRKQGKNSVAIPEKSRLKGFPLGEAFPWSYEEFSKRYGREVIEKEAAPIVLATPEQVTTIKTLLEQIRVSEDEISKVMKIAGVEDWADMETVASQNFIDKLRSKIK